MPLSGSHVYTWYMHGTCMVYVWMVVATQPDTGTNATRLSVSPCRMSHLVHDSPNWQILILIEQFK